MASQPNASGERRIAGIRIEAATDADTAGNPREHLEVAERRRQEVLVGVAGREHEPPDALWVARDDELAQRAARVVADEGDVLEIKRREELCDQCGKCGRREVGVLVHRRAVRAERQVRDDAAEAVLEAGDHLAPEGAVDRRRHGSGRPAARRSGPDSE